ncbi:MAG: hypothetical protein SGILL_002716 [Bacillariaceae sp.]
MSSESDVVMGNQPEDPGASGGTAEGQQQQQQQSHPQNGIDIRQALDILSSRTPHNHDRKENANNNNSNHHTEGGCCNDHGNGNGQGIPAEMRAMGQTIDLYAAPPGGGKDNATQQHENEQKSVQEMEQAQKKKAAEHHAALVKSLQEMTETSDLLRTLLRAQEDRVQTYKNYDAALQRVLQNGNFTAYPPACATATASFAMLSDTIRAVRDEMEARDQSTKGKSKSSNSNSFSQYVDWIQQLQSFEKEKLQLTAALHLEKIRARNLQEEMRQTEDDEGASNVLGLLQEGVAGLEGKVAKCVEDINYVLEDVRCALLEEVEEEEE